MVSVGDGFGRRRYEGHSEGAGVSTWLRSGDNTDRCVRREQNTPPAVVPGAHATSTNRNRAVPSGAARVAARGGKDRSDDALPRQALVGPVPPYAPRELAKHALAPASERLLADARNACRRDGVAPTRRELFARIAKRIGLPQAEVARALNGHIKRESVSAATVAVGASRHCDPVLRMATAILGEREREVFLARRDTHPDDVAALHQLASRLGLSVERVYEFEASARRKLARALG
jgi:hypothetical protein